MGEKRCERIHTCSHRLLACSLEDQRVSPYAGSEVANNAKQATKQMISPDYRILHHGRAAYAVEVNEPDRPPYIVSGFLSKTEAMQWITRERMKKPQMASPSM